MAFAIADRVRETSTTTGTGTLSLAGAVSGFRSFVSAIGTGNNTYYVISDGVNWEVGIGTVTSGAPNTLSRDTVLSNSLGNTTKVNFGAGSKDVAVTLPASKAIIPEDAAGGRSKLGLGTAATLNTGTGAGDIPTITLADARYVQPNTDVTLDDLTATTMQVTSGMGIGTAVPAGNVMLNASKTHTNADQAIYGFIYNTTVADSVLTANRSYYGAYAQLVNLRTASEAFNVTVFGTYSSVVNGGVGGSGETTVAYGTFNNVLNQANDVSANTMGSAYGTYNWMRSSQANAVITQAIGTYNRIDHDAGTITTAYGVFNSFEGTIGTAWGIYSSGEHKNYLSGSLGLGTLTPQDKLHVVGNSYVTGITKIGDGNAATPAILFNADIDTGIYRATSDSLAISTGGSQATRWNASNQYLAGGIGSAAVPILSFESDANTGIYSPGADQLAITTGGTAVAVFNSTQIMNAGLGTAAAPAFSFSNDVNTGMYSPAAGQLAFSIDGSARLTINANQVLSGGTGTSLLPAFAFGGDPDTGFWNENGGQITVIGNGVVRQRWFVDGRNAYYSSAINSMANGATPSNLQIISTDNTAAAAIEFHRSGITAVKLGLDTDGKFKLGGYSWQTERFTIDSTGNMVLAGNMTVNGDLTVNGSSIGLPGAVVSFARSTAPTGWLKANGAAVSRTTYADLFAAIGTTFGAGDGSTTFNLPDLRGEWIRGWDDARGVDASRAFGSFQDGQVLSHSHTATSSTDAHTHTFSGTTGTANASRLSSARQAAGSASSITIPASGESSTGVMVDGNSVSGAYGVYFTNTQEAHSHTFSGTTASDSHTHTITVNANGGTEARVRNRALLYCIKY